MSIYSIGHSNQSFHHFVSLLRKYNIKTLVDIRSAPYSRFVPQFNKKILEKRIKLSEIDYVYMGDRLGGKPEIDDITGVNLYDTIRKKDWFKEAIDELLELDEKPVAFMCAEEDPSNCHREKLVANALRKKGINVFHIRKSGLDKGNENLDKYLT